MYGETSLHHGPPCSYSRSFRVRAVCLFCRVCPYCLVCAQECVCKQSAQRHGSSLFGSSSGPEQVAHPQQDIRIECCRLGILACLLQQLVQALIQPCCVHQGVSLETTPSKEVVHNMMLRGEAIIWYHQGHMPYVQVHRLLTQCRGYRFHHITSTLHCNIAEPPRCYIHIYNTATFFCRPAEGGLTPSPSGRKTSRQYLLGTDWAATLAMRGKRCNAPAPLLLC